MAEKRSGWKCPTCGFEWDIAKLGHPVNDPNWKTTGSVVGLPVSVEERARGILRKVGIRCPEGCQVGQWEPLS